MNVKMQSNLISFLVTKEGFQFLEMIPDNLFIQQEYLSFLSILKAYKSKFNEIPKPENIYSFVLSLEKDNEDISEELTNQIAQDVFKVREEYKFEREFLINEIKKHKYTELAIKYSDTSKLDSDDFNKLHDETGKIKNIGNKFHIDRSVVLSNYKPSANVLKGIPTPYITLNYFCAAGGFMSPEHIVIAAPDKVGKTWFMISLALHFAQQGLVVAYVDFENGVKKVENRLIQSDMGFNFKDIRNPKNFDKIEKRVKEQKDVYDRIHITKLDAGIHGVADAQAFLDDKNPDVVFYDDLDIAGHQDKKLSKREQIRSNYFKAKELNTKYSSFSITVSKVNEDGSYSEHKKKSADADALFRFKQTPAQELAKILILECDHIREGVNTISSSVVGIFKIDKAIGKFEEISEQEYDALDLQEITEENRPKKKSVVKYPSIVVNDE